MHTLPLYAALLALLFVALSVRIIRLRRSLRIALGNAGNDALFHAISVHANFADYVLRCLILLCLVQGVYGAPGSPSALGRK